MTGIRAGVTIWYNTYVISRDKEMPQYLKQNPSLLTKVVDYLVVCVNDFADAHGLSYPNAHEYLSVAPPLKSVAMATAGYFLIYNQPKYGACLEMSFIRP